MSVGWGWEEVMAIISICSISIMYHLWRQVFNQSARSQLLSTVSIFTTVAMKVPLNLL